MRRVIRESELYPVVETHDPEQRDWDDGPLTWEGEEWHEVPEHVAVALHMAWKAFAKAHVMFYEWERQVGLRPADDTYVPYWVQRYREDHAQDEVEAVTPAFVEAAGDEATGKVTAEEDAS